MMKSIPENISRWERDEIVYREFYRLSKAGKKEEAEAYAGQNGTPEEKEWLMFPGSIDPKKTENDFFNTGRNVQIRKHPRFFPLFFHNHTFFEIIYVLSGKCVEYTGETRLTAAKVVLREGDLFLLAPNVTHGIEVLDDSIVVNILVRHSTFLDIFLNTVRDKSDIAMFFLANLYEKEKIPYLLFHTMRDDQICSDILEMMKEQEEMDEYSDRIVCAMLTIFFNHLSRRFSDRMETGGRERKPAEYEKRMMDYILRNYQSVSLKELARVFHFSVPYCSRVVKEISGVSFQDLVTSIRLQQAENLLSHTQMSIADIGDQTGYKNPETFIRAFQRIYHMSPSQYRKHLTM